MFACIVNALMFLLLLFNYYKHHKRIDFVFIILALYAMVAVAGIGYYSEIYTMPRPVTLLPFIYLFSASYCMFFPLIKRGNKISVATIRLPSKLEVLVWGCVGCCLISLHSIWTDVVSNIISGDWQSVKADAYSGNGESLSPVVSYSLAFGQYLRYLIYPYCFYCFTRKDKNFLIAVLILLLSVTTSLFQYLLTAYRGGIFSLLIVLLISFLMFYPNIPRKRRKLLFLMGSIVGLILIVISLSITNSRFEDSTNTTPLESLFSYFGQSMVRFNGGIANSATSYMGGKYFFMSTLNLSKDDFWIDSKYGTITNDGQDLDTLVGCFYLDFNPIVAFLIFFIVSLILYRFLRRKSNSWATLYILMFYLDLLVVGVFHGPSYLSQIVFNVLVIYFVILFIERYGYKNSGMLS